MRRAIALVGLLGVGCSWLAPSEADLTGERRVEAADAAAEAAPPCAADSKACAGGCVSLASPATGCAGASCEPCAADHAAAICVRGACALGPCENGWANCNGRPEDGCEVDTRESALFCGSCSVSCSGQTARCEEAECVPRCQAVKTTAASARIAFPATRFDFGTGDFTVEMWLAPHTDFVAASGSLFTSNEAYEASAIVMDLSAGAVRCLVTEPLPAGEPRISAAVPTDGAWHHVACVRAGGALSIYVDGAPRAQITNAAAVVASASGAIGRPSGYPSFQAPAVLLGPLRVSRRARYAGPFRPRRFWSVDLDTVVQWLTREGFDGSKIEDEAGADETSTSATSIVATPSTPCP